MDGPTAESAEQVQMARGERRAVFFECNTEGETCSQTVQIYPGKGSDAKSIHMRLNSLPHTFIQLNSTLKKLI